jgi:hypothetical protein
MADRRLNDVAFGLTVLSGLLLAGGVIVSIMYGVLILAGQYAAPSSFPGSAPVAVEGTSWKQR